MLAVFVGGVIVGGHAQATGLTRLSDPVRSLLLGDSGQELSKQVLDVLKDDYYVAVDPTQLERTSVQAIVDALNDPYTDYLDPDELEALRARNDGAYFGVGLQVAQRESAIVVTERLRGQPGRPREDPRRRPPGLGGRQARRPGRTLDAVVRHDPRGRRAPASSSALRRASDRRASLTLTRCADPRALGHLAHGDGEGREGGLRAPRPVHPRRGRRPARRGDRAARQGGDGAGVRPARGSGRPRHRGGRSGGRLPAQGVGGRDHEGLHSPEHVYRTDASPVAGDLPVVVLVDQNSASASEIVSGALRDAKRARLVGERTFGKALVQSTVPLRDGGALKLTTARYLTPSGYDLAKRGLPPAVKVRRRPRTRRRTRCCSEGSTLAAARMSRGGPPPCWWPSSSRRAAAPRPSRPSSRGRGSRWPRARAAAPTVGDLVTITVRAARPA